MALLVGLTGGMGSGKSIAGEMLNELGAHIIDADEICRSLIEPGKQAWREIVQLFGDEILVPDQTLNRKKLADIVFNDPEKKMALEGILHPKVFAEEQRIFEEISQRDKDAIVVINAPLLIESGNYRKMDKVVVVACEERVQVERIEQKGIFSGEEALKRIKTQMKLKEKLQFADYNIDNNSSVEDLRIEVKKLYQKLKSQA
ncbi:MAG: dephospho-CoA kinase [Nitrospinae bacterium]|nr:dephospho-CoA kinase [Nitrospinota bacterium]